MIIKMILVHFRHWRRQVGQRQVRLDCLTARLGKGHVKLLARKYEAGEPVARWPESKLALVVLEAEVALVAPGYLVLVVVPGRPVRGLSSGLQLPLAIGHVGANKPEN